MLGSLMVVLCLNFTLYWFIVFNFWRIMIKQRKIKLIPLTMFYMCAFVITITRMASISGQFCYYYNYSESDSYRDACYDLFWISGIVSNYFNIIMGFFQIGSIFELFFVLGQIKQAAKKNDYEAKAPSVVGIAISYAFAALASIASFSFLVYLLITYDQPNKQKYE